MKPAISTTIVTYYNDAGEAEKFEVKDGDQLHAYLSNLDKHKFITFKEQGITINSSKIIKVENTTKNKKKAKLVDGKPVIVYE